MSLTVGQSLSAPSGSSLGTNGTHMRFSESPTLQDAQDAYYNDLTGRPQWNNRRGSADSLVERVSHA